MPSVRYLARKEYLRLYGAGMLPNGDASMLNAMAGDCAGTIGGLRVLFVPLYSYKYILFPAVVNELKDTPVT